MASDEHPLCKHYPELRRFESRKEAQAVLKAWQWKLVKLPRFWFALLTFTVSVGLFIALMLISFRQWFRFPPTLIGPIAGGVTGGSATLGITWFWRNRCRRYLREQLVARGIPICIKCGYDLRGQVEPRCPECGTPCNARLIATNDLSPTS